MRQDFSNIFISLHVERAVTLDRENDGGSRYKFLSWTIDAYHMQHKGSDEYKLLKEFKRILN